MAENLKTLDINQFPKATEIKDDDNLLLIRPNANGKVSPMRVDGNLVPKASDVLLAEDTIALVADAKRAAFEGEKTTILAPTQVTSDIKFEKDINLSDGELHIKVQFNLGTGMPNGSEWKLMQIGEMNVYIVQHGINYNPQIQLCYPDGNIEIYSLYADQFEIILRKDGSVRYMTGNAVDPNNYDESGYGCAQQFKLIGFDTLAGSRYYTCEVFQYNFSYLKMSQLDNDCYYIKPDKDGILSVYCSIESDDRILTHDSIAIGSNSHDDPYPCIVFYGDDINDPDYRVDISATDDSIYLPHNTYIRYSGDDTDYNHVLSLSEIASYHMSPIYSIVKSLPPRGDSKTIYMIKKTDPTDPNVKYDKYIYIDEDSAWEKIG